tara:strand:+ start:3624 stop:4529 length:906 start_codon:yes stop_codon:yes gene_type:complete
MNTFSQSEKERDLENIIHQTQLEAKEFKSRVDLLQHNYKKIQDSLRNCLNPSKQNSTREIDGKFYALLIAVQEYDQENYSDLTPKPMDDAKSLKEVLEDDYNFQVEILPDPTKDRILMVLESYQETVKTNDNLLIFYAGHGGYDKELKDGFWCPKDATGKYYKNVNNTDIRNLIKKINSRNTLLIADACWSGSLSRSSSIIDTNNMFDIEKVRHYYNKKSRIYMSSGAMSTVPNTSIFLQNLVLELKNNKDKYLFSSTLFSRFELRCVVNTRKLDGDVVTPERKILQGVNHDAGDFIFIKE